MSELNNRIKGTSKCLIRHFAYYYNNGYYIHKEAKYRAEW